MRKIKNNAKNVRKSKEESKPDKQTKIVRKATLACALWVCPNLAHFSK